MKICFKDIILRDYRESDIADDIRWMTVETAWAEWDSPWEAVKEIKAFNRDQFIEETMKQLQKVQDEHEFRWTFEIDIRDGIHIGSVNSYLNDREYKWKPASQGGCLHTLGIGIYESSYWHKGYGTQAIVAFINYHVSQGIEELYTETWSSNHRMLAMAQKIGFELCDRQAGIREYGGKIIDGLTFKLNMETFDAFQKQLL